MELLQLKYFCTAAKTENFSQAARLYFVPASTVSKSVSLLEKELGVKLFNRQSNRVLLNRTGKDFYRYASAALDSLAEGVRTVEARLKNREISLLVLCSRQIITDFITVFREKHPETAFRISHDGTSDFAKFDLCVCDARVVPENFHQVSLFWEPYGIAVNRKLLPLESPVHLPELADRDFIMMHRGATITRDIERFCRKSGFEPKAPIVCEDPFYVRKYVEIGLGITFAPGKSWRELISGQVSLIELDDPSIGREVVFCFDPSGCPDLSRIFIRECREYVEGLEGSQ